MDKITDITIENNEINFRVYTDVDLTKYHLRLYVQEAEEYKAIFADDLTEANSFKEKITVTKDEKKDYYTVKIVNNDILYLDWNMKYFSLKCQYKDSESKECSPKEFYIHGLYFNYNVIYYTEIRRLHKYCSTCLDDKTMQTIVLTVFKRQLLDNALKVDDYKTAMQIYFDICRMLVIPTKNENKHYWEGFTGSGYRIGPTCHCDKCCETCCNGTCKLI